MIIRVKKKTLWFPQVFEDEGGLAGCEMTLTRMIPNMCKTIIKFIIPFYPST